MKKNIYGLRYLVKHEKPAGSKADKKTVDYTEPVDPCQIYDTVSDFSGGVTITAEELR